jgi:hypothetical protein
MQGTLDRYAGLRLAERVAKENGAAIERGLKDIERALAAAARRIRQEREGGYNRGR